MQETEFSNESLGCKAILKSNVNPELLLLLKTRNVVDLELNLSKGWYGDLTFLDTLTSLKKLVLLQIGGGEIDLSPIQNLIELTTLSLSTYSKNKIDFRLFPKLTDCSLEWQSGFSTIFESKALKKLFLNRYTESFSSEFAKLKGLEELSLKGTLIKDLNGISKLVKLRRLEISLAKNLTSLSGVEQLSQLEELDIHTCKNISSIQPISSLEHLKSLFINNCGDIESLAPIDKIKGLKKVLFYESTNILDGDLSPLTRQKELLKASFQNRKHYTHMNEDFEI